MATRSVHRMSRRPARLVAVVTLAMVAAGCAQVAELAPAPTPQPCQELYRLERCDAIAFAVADQMGVERDDIEGLEILPEPTPRIAEDGTVILEERSGAAPLVVRASLADGSSGNVVVGCGGIGDASDAACTDDPRLWVYATGGEGYRDIPCGADGETCATPVPPPDQDLVAEASPIEIDRLVIPIDHEGPYEVAVGEGSLPNGIITESSIRLEDEWPDGVSIGEGIVRLDVRSLEPDGKPFNNVYEHGWREGLERVEAVLVFEVTRFELGASLAIEHVVVR